MDNKRRCQSCGMPLGEGFFGTDTDGSPIDTYCKFCFQGGNFLEPNLTVEQMVARSIDNMTKELHFSPEKAVTLAKAVIPKLKRWT